MRNLFGIVLSILFSISVYGSHIVGGEMNYRFIGNGNYEITLTIYRDCYNGLTGFDEYAHLGIFDEQGNFLFNDSVHIADTALIPNAINTPCLVPPTNICYEVAHYYKTLILPPRPGGYIIAYQRCCRNYSIINIEDVDQTGATYMAVIPDQQYHVDDNPVYNNLPPTFICMGAPFTFDHSATDADGDSLVYSLCIPLTGADRLFPMPDIPSPPPYTPVSFQAPYSLANVFGGMPLSINQNTGLLAATPSTIGQFVYGVLVQEYRDGVLIGETRRDFQVNVTLCANYTVASIFSPTLACGTLQANFVNMSYGASTYTWNFGDPTTGADTSTEVHPAYTYPDTGTYPIQLIAYAPGNPNCNDTVVGEARVYPEFLTRFGFTHQHCTNEFQFIDSSFGAYQGPDYWSWNFGDGQYSGAQNPFHEYTGSGQFTVTLIASADSGCTDTVMVNIYAEPIPSSIFNLSLDTCHHTATFNNTSQGATSYEWIFGDNTGSIEEDPQHIYLVTGDVTAYLIVTSDSGCTDTAEVTFNLPIVPIANFTWSVADCDSFVYFTNLSQNTSNFIWTFGDNQLAYNNDPVHLYAHSGSYEVILQALGANLTCNDLISQTISLNRKPTADFTLLLDTCTFLVTTTNFTTDGNQFQWTFSDGFTDNSENPEHMFPDDGIVSVQLIAENDSGCKDTLLVPAVIPPLPISDFTWAHTECDSLVTFTALSQNTIAYRWYFGDGDSLDDFQAEHIYHMAGSIPVKLISTSTHQCRDTMDKNIFIVIRTPAEFEVVIDSCSQVVIFNNQSPLAVNYDWNFGDESSSTEENPLHIYPVNGIDYLVTLTVNKESACQESSQKAIRYEVTEGENIYVPNAFTPNGDGLNDLFNLFLWKPCDNYSLTIFDRWGHAVYQTDDAFTTSWDGRFKGAAAPEGVYVFTLKGSQTQKTGYVVLMR